MITLVAILTCRHGSDGAGIEPGTARRVVREGQPAHEKLVGRLDWEDLSNAKERTATRRSAVAPAHPRLISPKDATYTSGLSATGTRFGNYRYRTSTKCNIRCCLFRG